MKLRSLENRISRLERPAAYGGIDPLILAMEACCLTDNEGGLLQQLMSLLRAGFAAEQVQAMMGPESYEAAIDIAQGVDVELRRLEAPPALRAKRRKGKPLKVPTGWEEPDCEEDERYV